jgi:hypothetical protein
MAGIRPKSMPYSRLNSFAIGAQSCIFPANCETNWIEEPPMKAKRISFRNKRRPVRTALSVLSSGCCRLLPAIGRRQEPATLFQRCLAVHIGGATAARGLA